MFATAGGYQRKVLIALALGIGALFFLGEARVALAQPPCCTTEQIRTVADLNYIARVALNHRGTISSRLLAMNMAVVAGNWRSIPDPDVGELLGYMAATPDGKYQLNRALIDAFALAIGVTVKPATIRAPAPPPRTVVVPPAPPPVVQPDSARAADAENRAAIREELAGLHAQITRLASRLADLERTGTASVGTAGAAYPDLVSFGNGELMFLGRQPADLSLRQGRIAGDFKTLFGVNNYDAGARILQNWNHNGTKYLPYSTIGMDSRGTVNFNWFPAELGGEHPDNAPATAHSDTTNALYHAYRGQYLILDGGAQAAYDYSSGAQLYNRRNVLIAAQRAGQSIYFALSPERGPGSHLPLNRAVMMLESSPSFNPNPVHVTIDGTLRRLKSCQVGGFTVVCL